MQCPVTMHKAEKYALDKRFLDEKSISFLMQNFGCSRKVYNLYVDYLYAELEKSGYKEGSLIPDGIKFPEVTYFKKSYPYLNDVDSLGLSNAKISFNEAIRKFNKEYDHVTYTKRALRRDRSGTEPLSFRGLRGMPKFHSKAHGDFSYTTNCQYPGDSNKLKNPTVRLEGDMLYVPRWKHGFKLIVHRKLPKDARIGNVTLSMDSEGCFFASVSYTYTAMMEISIREVAMSGDQDAVDSLSFLGLDYAQQDFYVDSEGRKANYPRYYRKSEEKLARLQRRRSYMVKGSSNYKKISKRIARLGKKTANQRLDFINKEVCKLSKEYDVIVVEDINLRAMGECLSLGKNLHDNGFGMFRNRLSEKLEGKGSVLVKVDKWYPSSKTCSVCNMVYAGLELKDTEWTCPCCGIRHDRNYNAAINIEYEGQRNFIPFFRGYLEEKAKSEERAAARKARLASGRKAKRKAA